MSESELLQNWILEALDANGGQSTVIEIHKYVWLKHETDLRNAGDLFYNWQYRIRWAAQNLRDKGTLVYLKRGTWALSTRDTDS